MTINNKDTFLTEENAEIEKSIFATIDSLACLVAAGVITLDRASSVVADSETLRPLFNRGCVHKYVVNGTVKDEDAAMFLDDLTNSSTLTERTVKWYLFNKVRKLRKDAVNKELDLMWDEIDL